MVTVIAILVMFTFVKTPTGGIITLLVVGLGIGAIVYEVTSPMIESEAYTIVTNDYAKYSVAIESDRTGVIKAVEIKPARKFTLLDGSTKYTFVEFVE